MCFFGITGIFGVFLGHKVLKKNIWMKNYIGGKIYGVHAEIRQKRANYSPQRIIPWKVYGFKFASGEKTIRQWRI